MTRIALFFITFLSAALLWSQQPEVVVTTGHKGQINSMAISPDGQLMASGDTDKLIKIWDVATGRELRTLSGNSGRVNHVKFDATGTYLIAMLNNGEVKTWNARSGEVASSYPASSSTESCFFGMNNSVVVYPNNDNTVSVADFTQQAEPRIIETAYPTRVCVDRLGKYLYLFDHEGNLHSYDLASGAPIASNRIFEKFKYPVIPPAVDASGKYLVAAFAEDDYAIRIYDTQNLQEAGILKGAHTNRLTAFTFDANGRHLISADHVNNLVVWDFKKKLKKWAEVNTIFGIRALAAHPSQSAFIASDNNKILFKRIKDGEVFRTLEPRGNSVVNMAYDQSGRFVAIAAGDISIKLWDLQQNRISQSIPLAFFPVAFHPEGSHIASMSATMKIGVHDVFSGELLYEMDSGSELIQNLTYSKNGRFLAGSGYNGIVKVWDLDKRVMVHQLTGHTGGIYNLSFHPTERKIASVGMDGTLRVWDLSTGTEIKQVAAHEVLASDVKYSPDGKYLGTCGWDQKVKLWDAGSLSLIREFEGHKNSIMSLSFNRDGSMIATSAGNNAVSEADNSVMIWDVGTGAMTCHLTRHIDIVQKVVFEMGANYLFSAGNDGMVKFWDADGCEEAVSMITVNKTDYVVLTPDNYYTASRDALQGVSFRLDGKIYPFDQFDLRLNRPDIVAQRLGKSPKPLIDAYRLAYLKRLRKMNFTEEQLGTDFHLPEAEVVSEELPVTTDKKTLKVEVKFTDSKYKLDRVYVYVNDVPIHGVEGIDLRGQNLSETTLNLEVDLIPGKNTIQFSCMNEKGAESLRVTHEVIRETTEKTGDLHIIAVGVSKYKEKRFTLDYAAKDARDFIDQMKQSSHLYKNVHVKEITDSLATIENIMELKAYLENTDVEDVVVMFFAGHGMLNRDKEYFFGTYDIAFKNPIARGLSYTKIEELFNKTRALKKLLIMDTCHSGEVEDEDVQLEEEDDGTNDNEKRHVTVKSFATTRDVNEEAHVGLANSFDLMQTLFSDIRRGTGATVISSAGGAEYAYESAEWSNGLFTFCMLDGLKSKKADLNGDGKILVSELRKYVGQEVSALSGGKQHPTFRNENLAMDWQIW